MVAVTASDFARNFGRYKEEAQREPIAITSHGRTSGYFVSAKEYSELQRLRQFERHSFSLETLPVDLADAIESSNMDPSHNHLNTLLDK